MITPARCKANISPWPIIILIVINDVTARLLTFSLLHPLESLDPKEYVS